MAKKINYPIVPIILLVIGVLWLLQVLDVVVLIKNVNVWLPLVLIVLSAAMCFKKK